MSVDDKLSAKPQIDTTDFKTGITTMNRELKVLESGFRANAAELGDWSKSATGLESRITTLNSKIDIQKQKVEATRKEFERIRTEQGENSRAAQDMEIKLNRETESLGNMQVELQSTESDLVELRNKSDDAGESLGRTAKFSDILKGTLSGVRGMARGLIGELKGIATVIKGELAASLAVLKVGAGSVLALGSAAFLAGSLLVGMTLKAGAAADQLGELSDKTGISVQRLQELDFIGKVTGTSLESITGANARLVRSMSAAIEKVDAYGKKLDKAKESGKGLEDIELQGVAEAFSQLGVSVTTANGQMRDSKDVFNDVIGALGRIQNPTERDAIAMKIFGKSAQELNPLIKAGTQGLKDLADQANKVGAVVDGETVNALGNLNDQLDIFKSGLKGLGTTILGAFAPFLSGALQTGTGYLEQLVGLVRDSKGDFGQLAGNLGGFFTSIIQDAARAAPGLITVGLKIVTSLLKSILDAAPALIQSAAQIIKLLSEAIITNLPVLILAALSILPTLIDALLQALPQLFQVGTIILLTIITGLVSALPTLIPQLAEMAAGLVDQLLRAIQTAFPLLLPVATQLIHTLINFLKNNLVQLIQIGIPLISQLIQAILPELPRLVDAALKIIIALANGITQELPALVPVIVQVILQIIEVLTNNLPLLVNVALQLLLALSQGIVAALPYLIQTVPYILQAFVNTLTAQLPLIARMAAQIIRVLVDGIGQNLPTIIFAAYQILRTIYDTIGPVGSLKLLWNIGKGFVAGIWQGIKDNWSSFISNIRSFFTNMIATVHNIFDMHSPSGVGEDIGVNFISSIGSGGKKAARDVQQMFAQMTGQLSLAASTGLSVAGQTVNNDNSQQVKNVTLNVSAAVNNRQDVDYLAQQIVKRMAGA